MIEYRYEDQNDDELKHKIDDEDKIVHDDTQTWTSMKINTKTKIKVKIIMQRDDEKQDENKK